MRVADPPPVQMPHRRGGARRRMGLRGRVMKPRVLVLDDDEGVRDVVSTALRQEGYDVVPAGTIADARAARTRDEFELYILDVMLPDGNGLAFARELSRSTDAGIVLLTGRGEETDTVVGLEIGADDYVVKPVRPRELCARVNAVHRRTGSARQITHCAREPAAIARPVSDALSFHGFELRPASRALVDEGGGEVDLTTLEFDVLYVLARNANRVLTRDQIMDAAKGAGWAAYDRTVDGIISRIRGKLYPDGAGASRIKTIRNIGYMLTA